MTQKYNKYYGLQVHDSWVYKVLWTSRPWLMNLRTKENIGKESTSPTKTKNTGQKINHFSKLLISFFLFSFYAGPSSENSQEVSSSSWAQWFWLWGRTGCVFLWLTQTTCISVFTYTPVRRCALMFTFSRLFVFFVHILLQNVALSSYRKL